MEGEVASMAHNSTKIGETSTRNLCDQPSLEKTALKTDERLKGVQQDPIIPKMVTLCEIAGPSQWK